jgi:glycine oxidase
VPPHTIILGAGVIGCATAFELADAGARVSVFDVRNIGQGASQASAGMLAPYIEGHQAPPLRALGRRSLDMYDAFVERLTTVSGRSVQYARCGTVEVTLDADHAEPLSRSADDLRRQGVSARWLTVSELREVEPTVSTDALGGLLIEPHGFVSVPDLTDALAAGAVQRGARFELDSRVVSVGPLPDGRLQVLTDNGSMSADRVVLAAGSWAGGVHIEGVDEAVPVKPVRGQLLHLSWATPQPLRHVIWGPGCYLVPWPTGRVLVGATEEDVGFDERATAAGVRDLLEAGCSLVPHLWQASFEEVRVGLRPASPDGLPIVGASQALSGLVYAAGHYRSGVLLAPLTAALVKKLVMEEGPDPAFDVMTPSRLGRL